MNARRIQVKIYAANAPALDRFIPVFHRWIREKVLDELAIDVADYAHVTDGPGVVLIGHAYDYHADQSEGRFGIVYTRKRDAPPPAERLGDAVRRALVGARLVEQESGFSDVRFSTSEILVRLSDRLHAPNDAASFDELRGELEPLVERLYGKGGATIERSGEPREQLSARVRATNPPSSVADLLARLG